MSRPFRVVALSLSCLLFAGQALACQRAEPRVETAFLEAKHAVQLLGHAFPAGVRLCAVADLPAAAFTFPGEVLVSPQWAAGRSQDAIRFILAHELGHQLQYNGLMTVYEVGASMPWTREYQADSLAAEAMRKAGYPVMSAAREAFSSFDSANDTPTDSHPTRQDRLAALQR